MVKNRIKGVLFGQAIGDALGLGTEFMTKQDINLVDKFVDLEQQIIDSLMEVDLEVDFSADRKTVLRQVRNYDGWCLRHKQNQSAISLLYVYPAEEKAVHKEGCPAGMD